ncbi:MAG: hypothetical protein JWN40_1109 [Phycisphaerales bacterium]|nr:hypothetical protein [Phycisphaerales bacterium]
MYPQPPPRTIPTMSKRRVKPPLAPPRPPRPFIERPSTAILFVISVFAGGLAVGAILAKLRPPTPATTQPINYTVTQPTTVPAKAP